MPKRHPPKFLRFLPLVLLLAGCGGGSDDCRMKANEDGSHTLTCPDGSSVILPPMFEEQAPGGIRGVARRFGRKNHAGIRVQVEGTSLSTETAEDGSFVIADVDAGVHSVTFRAELYEEERREELLILPGAWVTEDVTLKPGRLVLGGDEWRLVPSPRGDRLLAVGTSAALIHPKTLDVETIASPVQNAAFSPDGSKVVTVGGTDRELRLYEIDARRSTKVANEVVDWEMTSDGDSLVFERSGESGTSLEVWHHPSRRRSAVTQDVSRWRVSPGGGALVALAQLPAGSVLIAWDLAASSGTGLGAIRELGADPLPAFAPDGLSFVFQTVFGDTVLWDGKRNETLVLEPGITGWEFGPDADTIQYVAEGALIHRDLASRSQFEIATSVLQAVFTPDGEGIAYVRIGDGGVPTLSLWDRNSRASRVVAEVSAPSQMAFDPSGRRLFLLDVQGRLHLWEGNLQGEGRIVSEDAAQLPQIAPDGDSYLFHEGDRLFWASFGGGVPVELGRPVSDYPVRWDAMGAQLFFVTGATTLHPWGTAWLFVPEIRALSRVGEVARLSQGFFLDDGSLLFLRRFDRERLLGELALGDETIGLGVTEDFRFTPDGRRILFRSFGFEIRERNVVALWEKGAPETVPLDDQAGDLALGSDWAAWVRRFPEGDRVSGIFMTHWPDPLPGSPSIPSSTVFPEDPEAF